jgi:hypothetical protein
LICGAGALPIGSKDLTRRREGREGALCALEGVEGRGDWLGAARPSRASLPS